MSQISITMVTHNRVHYIANAIESVLSQTFSDWELIVVDDGSTDNTLQVVQEYALQDTRIRLLINQENKGIVWSRNAALKEAQGKFIAILDSDDVWLDNEKLAKQVHFLETHPEYVLIGTGVRVIDKEGVFGRTYSNPEEDQNIRKVILRKNPFAHSSVLCRKESVINCGGYGNYAVGEDYDLFLKMGRSGKMHNLAEPMLGYRIHDENISRKKAIAALKSNLALIKKYRNAYPNFVYAYIRRALRYVVGLLLFR